MLKLFAAAVASLSVPAASLASSNGVHPTFSGAYQIYGQRYCSQESTLYTGTYTFYPAHQTLRWHIYAADGTSLFQLRDHVTYHVSAKSVTIDGAKWTATFHP